jgi:ornithine decarboxylase
MNMKLLERETPYFLLNLEQLRLNCRKFRHSFPGAEIYYAMKANNAPAVLQTVFEEGLNFDVASWGEIEMLKKLGVPPERMMFGAPSKIPRHIWQAYRFGVRRFAFDSQMELDKLAELAPRAQILARMIVKNEGSKWPLERKFGIAAQEAHDLFLYARQMGLEPYGLTFHVGSQNTNTSSWTNALESLSPLWENLAQEGVMLQAIDLGGGYPTQYSDGPVPDVSEMGSKICSTARQLYGENVRILVEPGRGLVGNVGTLVASVINRADRNGDTWLYLDAGIYHGLMEGMRTFGFEFPIYAEKRGKSLKRFILAGPTCDSVDIITENAVLPEDLTLGDRLYIRSTGAYSNSMEVYNGISFPQVVPYENTSLKEKYDNVRGMKLPSSYPSRFLQRFIIKMERTSPLWLMKIINL